MGAVKNSTALAAQENTVKGYLEKYKGKVISLLPAHVNPDRFFKSALLVISQSPDLQKCTPQSVFTAVLGAAELGIDFIPSKGHAYLIPYKGVATLMPGYRGLIDIAKRSGVVKRIEAHVVYENDYFVIEFGLTPQLKHRPEIRKDRGAYLGAYAVAWYDDNSAQFEYMTEADVEHVRKSSKTDRVWNEHPGEMRRKSPIRRIFKYLPCSPDLTKALEYDNDAVGIKDGAAAGTGTRTSELADMVSGMNKAGEQPEPVEDADFEDIPESPADADGVKIEPDELTDKLKF